MANHLPFKQASHIMKQINLQGKDKNRFSDYKISWIVFILLENRKRICLRKLLALRSEVIEFANTFLPEANLIALSATCQTNDPIPLKAIDIIALRKLFGCRLLASVRMFSCCSISYRTFIRSKHTLRCGRALLRSSTVKAFYAV